MKKKLTVVIPIFNVEQYLPKCIESVINQTYNNLEIILVNDGSTDGSSRICNEYAIRDKRIKVIHKINGGLSSARNEGLNSSTGFYIAFLDSDDWIDAEMYQTLVNLLEENDADISACGLKEIYDDKISIESNTGRVILYDRLGAINSLVENKNSVRFEVWNKVFKRGIIGETRFKEKQIYEDVYFDRKVFLKLNTLVYVDLPFHNYLKVRQGNTKSSFSPAKLSIFDELDGFSEELEKNGMVDTSQRFQAFALYTSITLYINAFQLKSPKSITDKIRARHLKYHHKVTNNPYVNKLKSKFFLNFPYIFYLASNLKYQVSNLIKK